ncbi:MAG: caspase family protein [Verrucomicrobiales bacterium]|nr:caspase family protein [Verrucomicrobiales bacterium]
MIKSGVIGRLGTLVLLAFTVICSEAAERVAFVVGNSDYQHAGALANPENDARSVAAMLEELDFKVITVIDADVDKFYSGLDRFIREAAGARVGLFYYAGHGIEVENQNYLIPIDAELQQSSHLRTQAISLHTVLDEMSDARIPAKMVVLDCCRNNPLTRSWMSSRSIGKGLAPVTDRDIPEATMILFAAKPGQVALDGEGKNSPFTTALVSELTKPGRNAMDAFLAVSDAVVENTGRRQEPWVKLDGAGRAFRSFSLVSGDKPVSVPAITTTAPTPPKSEVSTDASMTGKKKSPGTPGMKVVPDQYSSIQEAINEAVENDVILIKSGTYREMLNIPKTDGLEIRGAEKGSVFIQVPADAKIGNIVTIDSREAENLKISNLNFSFNRGKTEPEQEWGEVLDSHIQVVNGSVEIQNCDFEGGMHLFGVRVLGGKGMVMNCQFQQCLMGVQICNPGTKGFVSGCEIENSYIRAITIFGGAEGTVERCKMEGAIQLGIAVVGQGTKGIIKGNTIRRCGVQGIEASGAADLLAENNTCTEHTGAGILAFDKGSQIVLKGNRCIRNEQAGIGVMKGAEGEIIGNICSENLFGISGYEEVSFKIRDNHCDNNRNSGITVETGDCEVWVTGNRCSGNGEFGIGIAGACYPKEFSNNTASGNGSSNIDRNVRFQQRY